MGCDRHFDQAIVPDVMEVLLERPGAMAEKAAVVTNPDLQAAAVAIAGDV